MIAAVLVLHHLAATAQFVVYTMEKTTTDLAFQLQLVRAVITIAQIVIFISTVSRLTSTWA